MKVLFEGHVRPHRAVGFLVTFATLLVSMLTTGAQASVVFSNLPDPGIGGNYLGFPGASSQQFSLASGTTVTSMSISVWSYGSGPSSMTWTISSAAKGVGSIATGTSSVSNAFYSSQGVFTVFDSTFSIPSVALSAGNWFLTLTSDNPGNLYNFWGVTRTGVGTYSSYTSIDRLTWGETSNQFNYTLRIEDAVSSVAEPTSLALVAMALAAIGARGRDTRISAFNSNQFDKTGV